MRGVELIFKYHIECVSQSHCSSFKSALNAYFRIGPLPDFVAGCDHSAVILVFFFYVIHQENQQ